DMVSGRNDSNLIDFERRKRSLNRKSCIQAHARLIFLHDGTANYCCPDIEGKLAAHNIHKMTLSEIFNSQYARNLRRSLNKGKAFSQDPCKSCPSFESYKGYVHPWTS